MNTQIPRLYGKQSSGIGSLGATLVEWAARLLLGIPYPFLDTEVQGIS